MQIWYQDKHVGEYNAHVREGTGCHYIAMEEIKVPLAAGERLPYDHEPAMRRVALPVRRHQLVITHEQLNEAKASHAMRAMTMLKAALHVPADAKLREDTMRSELYYVWPVLTCSLEVYEEIFDLDEFEPV